MDATEKPNNVQVVEVQPETAQFDGVLELASRVLAQHRDLASVFPAALESHVLAAFHGARCAGFLRYLVQVIGAEEGRPAVTYNGAVLKEGYVEAFGVDPQLRRHGVGTALQEHAMRQCRLAGCFQRDSVPDLAVAHAYLDGETIRLQHAPRRVGEIGGQRYLQET